MPKLKNIRWENFAKAYVSDKTYGNAFRSYCEAYKKDPVTNSEIKSVEACSSRLLSNAKVLARVHELLEKAGFNDEVVDTEHLFLIKQHVDLKSKMAAIKEYNALKKRTTPNGPVVNQNIISYEQHIINNTYGNARVVQSLREDEKELQRVQESLPEDQHEVVGANQIQAQSGSGDIRELDSGAGEAEEAYPGFSS